ncbi:MAG: glycosyltransferase [Gammaproteobacteria bacterium]|nr:glycosyltransferase [Gammaproteobacteria bacterium]
MKILFLHRNFPAQFRHLLQHLRSNKNNTITFITNRQDIKAAKGIIIYSYKLKREPNPNIHPYLLNYEEAILHGQAAARAAIALKAKGFIPDIIIGHAWGNLSFIKDVFPDTPLVGYFEWFYNSINSDVNFAHKGELSIDKKAKTRAKNAHLLTELYSCDYGIVPTKWQQQQIPAEFQTKLTVMHDGIDTNFFKPKASLPGLCLEEIGINIPAGQEIVTYATRGLEQYRGFPQFMEAVEIVQKQHPKCHFIIAGDDLIHYGPKLASGKNFRELMLERLDLDLSRIHFTGFLPYSSYLKILQASWVHVYLTYPFVLSWSMLEAMSTECLLVASSTQPVLEVVKNNENGFLIDFFSPEELADRIAEGLKHQKQLTPIRKAARETIVENYDLQQCLKQQLKFLTDLVSF